MKKIICAKCEEEKEHHSRGLCRECYDWERTHSQNKICEGCEKQRVTNKAKFGLCKRCIQLGLRNKLIKTLKTGSGKELRVRWEDGRWVLLHLSSYEAEQIRRDLAAQLVIVHQKT